MSTDPKLGWKVHQHLESLGLAGAFGHPIKDVDRSVEKLFEAIMEALGLDLLDDSLKDTPARVAKMYCEEIFTGLSVDNFPRVELFSNAYKYDELITSKATVRSVCEHHFVPFIGHATVGYLPKAGVIGLSKINRIVDFYSRRPQVQERLTCQIAEALSLILGTEDVAVVIRAKHFCVALRGVQDNISDTVTSRMKGRFLSQAPLRAEFLQLAHA